MNEEKDINPETEEPEAQTAEAETPESATEDTPKPEETETVGKFEKKKVKKLEAKIAELEKQIEDLKAESAEKDNKYMLLYAEYDNFRRRTQKEKDGIYTDAYSSALNSLLPVLDNLYRAVDADESGLAEGLKMTVKSYEDALAKMGIEEIKAVGEKFNPELHCAVFHVDDEAYGENEIIEVLAKGYKKGERVIRYSIVKVAN